MHVLKAEFFGDSKRRAQIKQIAQQSAFVVVCDPEDARDRNFFRYATFYNQQLPQSALASKTPLQAMKDWHKVRSELLKKQPYYLTVCDT